MELHTKTFRLRVEREVALTTMETVLSVVRRGGLALNSLRLAPGRHGVDVFLDVSAAEAEPLQLCRTRLCNLIGILKIRELPGRAGGTGLTGAPGSDCPMRRTPTASAGRA